MVSVPSVPPARLDALARVLRLVAEMPGRRERPQAGDLPGAYDVWFDGGACAYTTDFNRFQLADGASAWISTAATVLAGGVRLASGETVTFEQERPGAPTAAPRLVAGTMCAVCGGVLPPGGTYKITPKGPVHPGC